MKKVLIFILILLIIIFFFLLYGRFIGIKGLKTHEIVVADDKIPIHYDGFKIVHFADIHYKKVIGENEIRNLVHCINLIKPDLVLFTGDLVDNDYQLTNKDISFLIDELSKIDSKYGIYAILGDEDVNSYEAIQNIYIQSDITLLSNDNIVIQNEYSEKLLLSSYDLYQKKENVNLGGVNESSYHIFMTHEPDNVDDILNKYSDVSLILSSHSINGSINVPVIKNLFLPNGAKKYFKPFYRIHNTSVYITNGIGVNRINFRLFNKPSINFYRLKKK